MSQIQKNGNFRQSTDTQYVGQLNALGYNSIVVNVSTSQKVATTPPPTLKLNIFKSNIAYEGTETGFIQSNINELELCQTYNIDCSISTARGGAVNKNSDLSILLNVESRYYNFTISDPSVADLEYNISANSQHNMVDLYKTRDKKIELCDIGLLNKIVNDYRTDVQSGIFKGMSAWSMSCKGNLTNSEFLLFEDGVVSTKGYFDTSGEVHKANNILMVSNSTNDNSAGIGGRQVKIHGLNADFGEITQTATLNGLTEVSFPIPMTDINFAEVTTSGGLYCNAGVISIYNTDVNGGTSANPMCSIPLNYGKHQNPQYTVPLGYELIIQRVMISSHCEDESEIIFNKYKWGSSDTNINKHRIKTYHLHSSTTVSEDVVLNIDEKERFTVTAQTSTAPTGINRVSVEVFGYLKLKQLSQSTNASYTTKNYIEGKDSLPLALPYI